MGNIGKEFRVTEGLGCGKAKKKEERHFFSLCHHTILAHHFCPIQSEFGSILFYTLFWFSFLSSFLFLWFFFLFTCTVMFSFHAIPPPSFIPFHFLAVKSLSEWERKEVPAVNCLISYSIICKVGVATLTWRVGIFLILIMCQLLLEVLCTYCLIYPQ